MFKNFWKVLEGSRKIYNDPGGSIKIYNDPEGSIKI